ncbi:flagellar hook-associated protein FlgK [Anaerovorax odorimutans]|uniref:flagellar hook-associated protein FlgK n=1 Tax=Anaerovorax odorimutans TaxID=109327 RepID=UPI00041FF448|nr:flagellar hook-associated protein FlgK [Anaerovorax odorimutans]
MIRSTFFGFTTALSGLRVSQRSLDVTGQNISNINTEGYTRQRLDLYSQISGGIDDKYTTRPNNSIGQGVGITKVEQIRNPFLDVRFRREACKVGEIDSKLATLKDLEYVFDETMTKGLDNQVSDFIKQLQSLSSNTGNSEFDGIAKASAEVLTKLFNQYANQVETVRNQQEYQLDKVDIPKINDLLKNIAEINKSIRNSQLQGNPALELMDTRNLYIDELSNYMKIDVTYTPNEIAPGVIVDDINIDLISDSYSPTKLIDNEKYGIVSSTRDATTGKIGINLDFNGGGPVAIGDHLDTGVLKGNLDMLNNSGEFDSPTTTRGIGYYEKMLDTIASKFAEEFNESNKLSDGTLQPLFGKKDGTPATDPITAKNLCIAEGWANCTYGITASKNENPGGNNDGAADNILYMISLFSKKLDFKTTPGNKVLFTGTFQECLGETKNILALDKSSTEKIFKNYYSVLTQVDDSRQGISAVSLDEEGVNLLKFQKSYNAAARLMTTLDEAIDTVINKMGVVGR